ncbi:gliding motility-associated C-terminal domain-containing protein [Flavobacterium aquidurense]|uniref:T9SS type B sorting domain-containing protein n=1 Tax=Flavobacterium aquidurense TaxID=362413 RepID=UPI00286AF512|nr:gliding motility-associated C-terminal domain-containing protein [Flavobacterium aquidurense]
MTPSQTNASCNGGANGTATVAVTGGTGAYTYSWSPSGGTAATASGLAAGTYTVTIKDANLCQTTQSFTITQPAALSVTPSQTNASCNGGTNGTATVAVTGGTGAYTYSWSPSGGTAATASGLAAGTYMVTIKDANLCQTTQSFTITQPAALSVTPSQTNASCNGGSNGTATVAVTGGTGAYTYSWSPTGGTAATASGLAAGTYTVTIKDANLCQTTQSFTITQPAALSVTPSQTNASCNGGSNGTATVNVTGGTGAYTYSWSPSGGTAATASGLAAGTYTVTIKDANLCQTTQSFTITQPAALSVTPSQTNASCNGGANGTATVAVTGGTGAYTYSWSPSGGTAATASGLAAGTYTVTIKDANLCQTTQSFTITQPAALSVTPSQTNASCNGSANGTATVAVTGGTGAYTYSWSPSGGTAATASGLAAGTYTVTIKDANLCQTTQSFTITQPAALSVTPSQTNASCNGGANGTATVAVTGGTGAYTYSWSPSGGTAATASGLAAGTYTVTIKDANLCQTTQSFTITQPAALSVTPSQTNASCNGGTNGTATVAVTGGTGAYTYSWSPSGGTAATASGLAAGTYTVTIKDANLCQTTQSFTITQPEALTATTSQTNVGCGGAATGSASVVVSGGTSSYTYVWSPTGGNAATASGLIAGSYSVLITDANGCTLTKPVTIQDGDAIKPIVNPLPETTTINCPAEPVFAQATATDDNGTIASLTHQDETIPGNCAGSKTVIRTWTATDACGNVSLPVSQTIIVQDVTAPTWETAANSLDKTIECNNTEALASAQALFPIASDTCDSDVTDVIKISGDFVASEGCSKTGTYTNTWTVKDDCGNTSETFTQVITIEDTAKPTFLEVPPTDITVSCDAVPAPAEMEASDNCSVDLPIVYSEVKSDIQNECNTNYTLTRTWTTSDCAGNEVSYTQIIKVQDTTAPTGTAPADVADLQSITDIPAGSPSDITDAADNCSTNINITVSDSNNDGSGCEGSPYILTRTYTLTDCAGNETKLVQTFTVENKVSVSGVASNVTCLGANDGSIVVTNSPGSTVVITNANNEVVGNTDLPAGTYTLTATSPVNGEGQTCTATATVTITEPTYTIKISGQIINVDTNSPIANVPVTLIPQGTTTGPILFRLTGADGMYSFTGMAAGSYLVQVQDANLNSAYQLYPVDSSLFFTTLEDCKFQVHNFEYGKSNLPVLGDYVWYDTNGNGKQDEWYDANNDGIVTKNIPDTNGAIDYSLWEWIDFNGDGSYTGPQNAGELNAGGFGNALSSNVIVDGPNGYHDEVIVGIQGYWRNRPESPNPYGQYTVKLVHDANFDTAAAALGATGLVKVIPTLASKKTTDKTAKAQMHTVCKTTTEGGYIVNVTPEDLVHLDIDFGVNCKQLRDIVANDDTAGPIAGVNHTTTNVLNVLPNDTIEGVVVTPSDVIITTVTPNEFLQLNPDGSVDVLPNAPAGTLTMIYQICEADETSNCDTATVTITIEAPVMTVTATPICINDVPYVDYVVTPGNFTPVNGVTIAWADSNNNVITTMNNLPLSGRVLWPGAVVDQAGNGVDWPGWLFQNNQWIQGADGFEKLRPTATLTISLNPSQTIVVNYPPADPYCTARPTFAIIANDDTAGPISGNTGGTNVVNVYTNDTLNGNSVNPADVTLTTVTPDPKGALTLNPDGSVNVAPNTPSGTYVLTYQICENADFGNCDTAIITITVVNTPPPPPVVNAQADLYSVACNGYGNVGNVLNNDTIDVGPALLSLLNFTLLPSSTGNPGITVDASGNVNVATTTPPGTYTYNYQICLKNYPDVCTTRSVTITVQPNITNLASTACNDDSTPIDLMSLLPEGAPRTGTWVDTNGSNALQGSIFNPFGLALGNYVFEYKIADQSCPRTVLLAVTVNDDCKVLACGNVVVHNAFSPNGDGINDVFTIESIDEITCYPENSVEIYNRWGILVFETSNYNNTTNAFDGTSRGRTTVNKADGLPSGTYFYIINYKSLDGNNVLQSNKKDGYLYLSK